MREQQDYSNHGDYASFGLRWGSGLSLWAVIRNHALLAVQSTYGVKVAAIIREARKCLGILITAVECRDRAPSIYTAVVMWNSIMAFHMDIGRDDVLKGFHNPQGPRYRYSV